MHYLSERQDKLLAESDGSRGDAWYVVYTKPRQEAVAKENLERQNFEVYFPQLEIVKRHKDELIPFIEPFFPRYIFMRFDRERDNWGSVRSTRGVSGLVRFEGVPKAVPSHLIEALRQNENSNNLQQLVKKTWNPGDTIEIEQGPFAGYRCVFQAQKSSDRVFVLLDIVGKKTRATLLKKDLQVPQFA